MRILDEDTLAKGGAQGPRGAFVSGLGAVLLLTSLSLTAGCEDDIFKIDWAANPDTVILYSLARPELNLYSGFDFLSRSGVRIESPGAVGEWDLALDTWDGELVFLPPGAIGVDNSTAGIAPMGSMDFQDLKRAPRDTTLYVRSDPVPVDVGDLYVIRSRRAPGSFGSICNYYGKLVPLAIDPQEQTVTFYFDMSPVCNDRKLTPTKKN